MVQWDACRKCEGGPKPGLVQLTEHWESQTGLGNYGIYSCRSVRGGSTTSVHSCGRAADLACNANDPAQRRKGDDYAAWLVSNANALGIQLIIWNRRVIGPGRYGWKAYGGSNPHIDHLHVEMTRAAAARGDHPLLGGTSVQYWSKKHVAVGPGSRGPLVTELQQKMNTIRGKYPKAGLHKLNADGIYGAKTKAAWLKIEQLGYEAVGGPKKDVDGTWSTGWDRGLMEDLYHKKLDWNGTKFVRPQAKPRPGPVIPDPNPELEPQPDPEPEPEGNALKEHVGEIATITETITANAEALSKSLERLQTTLNHKK